MAKDQPDATPQDPRANGERPAAADARGANVVVAPLEAKLSEEFRGQRHAFILAYYDMATKDLDRHLKNGWQTIVVLAGATATLGLGLKGDFSLPIAATATLLLLGWCAQNVYKTNMWSLRAIGFLANVEAVYFTKDDAERFNPYVGRHPPWHLIESLEGLSWLIRLLTVLSIVLVGIALFDPITLTAQQNVQLVSRAMTTPRAVVVIWMSPFAAFVVMCVLVARTHRGCLREYRAFIKQSPGPGLVKDMGVVRSVDFRPPVAEASVIPGAALQGNALCSVEAALRRANCAMYLTSVMTLILAAALLAAIIYASDVVGWFPGMSQSVIKKP